MDAEVRRCIGLDNRRGSRTAARGEPDALLLLEKARSGETLGSRPERKRFSGAAPGAAHGRDVDEEGWGTLVQPRLYQLVREPGSITDRTFEVAFLDPGVEAYVFTFG